MSNYASSSMSSLSTLSATSNVSPMLSPSPSNISLYATLPRSPLRKTATGGQHPLATVSTFESDPATAINEATESVEADKSCTDTQQPTVDSSAAKAPSTLNESIQLSLKVAAPSLKDTSLDHPKSRLLSEGQRQTGSSNIDKKQEDLRVLKSAVLSGSHNILMLQIKAGTQSRNLEMAAAVELGDNQETSDPDWESVAVTSGDTQPLSPLTASYPVSIHCPLAPSSTSVDTSADESTPTESVAESEPQTQTLAETTRTTATPSPTGATTVTAPSEPKREFEMWMPPPPRPRQTQDTHRAQPQPQHHSRLHFPRLLKQRSFNFPFTTSSSSASGTSSLQSGSGANPASRASVDGGSSSQAAGSRSEGQDRAERTSSCDIPRPVGPPDPIPPHYQHLQNRQNRRSSSFRRRSHAGELERFSPGWVVVENSHQGSGQTGGATSPTRASMSDDQAAAATSTEAHQRRSSATTSRRHVSLGVQPHLTSMWGRLLTSILPSGNDHHQHAQDTDSAPLRDRDNSAAASALPLSGDVDPYLQQQRLLLTPLSQQQQIHPLYQQQLFFYADEVVSEPTRRISESSDPPCFQSGSEDASNNQPRRSMASESLRSSDSLSFFPALAHNAHLQGELAQEDGRESLEMSSSDSGVSMRPDSFFGPAVVVGSDTILSPRSLSADGKIPVSSLALSQPPSYWEAEIKYKGWPKIVPRPELGQEALPRRTFAHLRGTALRLYAVDMEDVPRLHVRNISLQLAKCEIATDYKQRPNVIRIRACDRTVLIECKDRVDALTWLEHLQAAANIATSLEDRSMPKFYTLPRAPPQSQHQQQSSRSAASSNAQSSGAGSNVSARNHQQTPQPLPPVPPLLAQQQQRRASVVPMVASPRSSTEVDAGAGSERRVRRSRSGGLLATTTTTTRSERNSSDQERRRRDRRSNNALSDEAVLRNVLHALGHTPELNSGSSPSTDENEVDEEDDSEDDEDDGQATDVEAYPSSAASMTAAAVAAQGSVRLRRSAGHRCGGTCHHHHSHSRSHRHRGHHHHDHNMTDAVADGPAMVSVIATDDEGGHPPAGGRRSEGHSGLETPTSTRGLPRLVTSPSAQTATRQQQRASWNRRLFGGLWNHHHESSSSQQQQQQHTPEPLTAAT
ncbi:hypothetical protein KI688_005019 [Linnemannia hyalina]|uniref:PH domain-containing protein n=1 Tax=Linnemannia hyalina TaxID=64524 RepID=A0A9P7XM98_9FUNG|nr:hypothetical protein KI688_005019 [Linnemannia hyalina]